MARGIFKPPPIRFYNAKQLGQQANRQVAASIKAQQAPILLQQQQADARARAAQAAISGFGTAAAGILKDVAPMAGAAYQDAAAAQGNLAAGYSGQMAQDVQQQVAQHQAMIDQLAPGGQLAGQDTTGMQNAMYALGGYIPGASNEAQAAAAITQASQQPGISVGQTMNTLTGAQAQQTQADEQYTQDMLNLAAQEPQLRQQIMAELQKNELDKRSAYIQQQAQNALTGYRNAQVRQGQQRINIEQANAITARERANTSRLIQQQGLILRGRQIDISARNAATAAARLGGIDYSGSKARGYLVDHAGNAITDPKTGKHIPVAAAVYGGRSGANTGPGSTDWKAAWKHVQSTWIDPGIAGGPTPGFSRPPFHQMIKILVNAYGLSRANARKVLFRSGIKANGQRPGKK